MYCLTSIQVRSFLSHLHPCDISPPAYSLPFKSWYLHHSSIHVLSHTNPRFNISARTPSRSRLTSIQVPWLAFHTHPSCPSTPSCCISIPARSHLKPIQVFGWASHLHPCPGSPPFSFLKMHPTSIHIVSPLHPGFDICISSPSMLRLISRWRDARLAAQLYPCSIHRWIS